LVDAVDFLFAVFSCGGATSNDDRGSGLSIGNGGGCELIDAGDFLFAVFSCGGATSNDDRGSGLSIDNGGGWLVDVDDFLFAVFSCGGATSRDGCDPCSSTDKGCICACDFADPDDLFFVPVELPGSESGFRILLRTRTKPNISLTRMHKQQ
jgi:hypothetical protein